MININFELAMMPGSLFVTVMAQINGIGYFSIVISSRMGAVLSWMQLNGSLLAIGG